ncbi:UbiA prenyltransferase family protein [Riemerella columbipharyngis]|uniref:UbiA prenyltransferase family protein n=1 Tax=Riemerella columbipharyngis TaxID=1071918 RepID=A0A1G7BLX9_9FLAO|nr:hypothetical protein [Riemerella columbipharyngis]SDE27953.1 hypothetical protein SAMN05421544_10640 [Riemerella columbipharyngis]
MISLCKIKKYLIDSQIYVSFMGTFLAVFFMMKNHYFSRVMIFVVFLTYFSGYLYTKYQNNKKILHKIIYFNIFTFLLCGGLLIYFYPIETIYKWTAVILIGLLYDSFFLHYFIRKIPLFKIFYVGFAWALMNGWLFFKQMDWEIFFISWTYITALVLPFDIRDINSDKVVTFPKLIGIQNTKYLAYGLIFISTILAIYHLDFLFALAFYIAMIFCFLLIYFSEPARPEYYYSFLVESCCGLPFLFLVLLHYIWELL